MSLSWIFLAVLASPVALVAVSFIVEAVRRAPQPPGKLTWAPSIAIRYVDIGGVKVRYVKTGAGPNLVLLHTLRTQLDLFEKIVPDLAKHFTVYALDYPGHGYSDIPSARYNADFFVRCIEDFLHALDLGDVTLCGVSIGGAIGLIIAGRRDPRVVRVVAINPYDYAKGRGMARSSLLGWMITVSSELPVVGETVMRLRNFIIMKAVLRGGVADPENIRPELLKEMYDVGNGAVTTELSSASCATPRAGRAQPRSIGISTCPYVWSGASRIGPTRRSATRIIDCCRTRR